jgi:hypothetical protein
MLPGEGRLASGKLLELRLPVGAPDFSQPFVHRGASTALDTKRDG